MIIQVNIKNPELLEKGCILVYNGTTFDAMKLDDIFEIVKKEVMAVKHEVDAVKKANKNFKKVVGTTAIEFAKAFAIEKAQKGETEE